MCKSLCVCASVFVQVCVSVLHSCRTNDITDTCFHYCTHCSRIPAETASGGGDKPHSELIVTLSEQLAECHEELRAAKEKITELQSTVASIAEE